MDPHDYFKELNAPKIPVKEEIPDEELAAQSASRAGGDGQPSATSSTSDAPESYGISEMNVEMQKSLRKEQEQAQRMAEFLMNEDQQQPPVKKRRGRHPGGHNSTNDDSKDDEFKVPLTTFGHSSRPRRSVNYASIERGDEAQSQSLVQEFGSGKKRPKRTRDELDENYDEEKPSRDNRRRPGGSSGGGGSGRPRVTQAPPLRNNYLPPGAPTNSTQASARAIVEHMGMGSPEEEFRQIVPQPSDERPDSSSREKVSKMDLLPAIRRASGGFRRFIMWFNDVAADKLVETVKRRCKVMEINDNQQQFLQCMRHVYNTMSQKYRLEWEMGARQDIHCSNQIMTQLGNPPVAMPLSETLMKDSTKEKPRNRGSGVRANCCEAQPILGNMCQTIEHYLQNHDVVHFFGCDICHKVYSSRYELTKHDCPEFSRYMYELVSKQKTLTLEAAYMYLCCSQCGLWLPVKATNAAMKGWTYFGTAILNHSCIPLVPVIIYFRQALKDDGKSIRMSLQVIPFVDATFPMSCEKCGIEEFESFAATEEHFKTNHEVQQCQKCTKTYGTDFAFKHHQQSHMSSSAQFANYLMYSASYEPPANSNRSRHVGIGSEIPVVGGLIAAELQLMEASQNKDSEFVNPYDDTTRRKLHLWKRQKAKKENRGAAGAQDDDDDDFSYEPGESSGEEEYQKQLKEQSRKDSGEDSDDVTSNRKPPKIAKKAPVVKKTRGDMGYEHLNRAEMFEKSEDEKEARKLLDKLFSAKCLMPHERLLKPEETLKILKEAQNTTLPPQYCELADEIAKMTVKPVQLPAANCIDPLKDYMLVNRIFVFCENCNEVISSDVATHSIECPFKTPEDELIEVFHAAAGPHTGVKCIYPECKAHLCSVVALRFHLQNTHQKYIKISTSASEGSDEYEKSRYDRSMMGVAKYFQQLQFEDRSYMARMTDMDCYLPFDGFLEGRIQNPRAPRQVPLQAGRPVPPGQPFNNPMRQILPPVPQLEQNQQRPYLQQNGRAHTRCKPYKVPRTSRWYGCQFCDREYETLDSFVDHLVKCHMQICQLCGKCYSSSNTKRTHYCNHAFSQPRKPGWYISASCPGCTEVFSVEKIYDHMYRRHFSQLEFVQATGELLPMARDLCLRPANAPAAPTQPPKATGVTEYTSEAARPIQLSLSHEQRMKTIRPSSHPIHGVDRNKIFTQAPVPPNAFIYFPPNPQNIDTRLMCYLCELTFANDAELAEHLEEHPEKWRRCPFCPTEVHGHYDFQKHLLTQHVCKIAGALCCGSCQEAHRYLTSHILFRCKRLTICTVCGQRCSDNNAARIHMQRSHNQTLRRFSCSYCTKAFGGLGEYYEHDCPNGGGHIFSCSCNPAKFFNTPSGFCDHYDSMHIHRNHCKLCNSDHPTQDQFVAHRSTHMKTHIVSDAQRKVYILMGSMVPPPSSGYRKFIEQKGPRPRSYDNVDRSRDLYMMGNSGRIITENLRTHTVAPPTLSEILNAQFATPAPPPQQQRPVARVVTIQGLNQQHHQNQNPQNPPRPPTTTSEIVELSDDDDDDIVFEKAVPAPADNQNKNPSDSKNGGKTTPDQPTLDRQIRVEQAQDGYGASGAQQPGYVADDDDLEVAPQEGVASNGQPVVKAVVDENADDELECVAEVEHAAGTLPSSISAGREKKHKCTQCSQSFYTSNSLKEHMKGHRQDAGQVMCKEDYGLPVDLKIGYLCRNCCVCFEDEKKHRLHMAYHGEASTNCPHCSGVGLNVASTANHAKSHSTNSISYSCGQCQYSFSSDLQLMDHLSIAHNVALFYFCKVCNYGSSVADLVYQHINQHHGHPYTLAQRFGACPAVLLHFDPKNEQDFRAKLLQKLIKTHTPTDCSHRSMLLSTDCFIACLTCFCLQCYHNFAAVNNQHKEEGTFPNYKTFPLEDSRKVFPLIRHLTEGYSAEMAAKGNLPSVPSKQVAQQHMPRQPAAPAAVRNPSTLRPCLDPAFNNVTQRHPQHAPVVSMTANGARVIHPAHQLQMMQQQRQQMIMNHQHQQVERHQQMQQHQQHHHHQQQQQQAPRMSLSSAARRLIANSPAAAPGASSAASTPLQQRVVVPVTNKCKVKGCEKLINSEFERQIHLMHLSPDSWFCRQCGQTKKTEMELVQHYIEAHVALSYEKLRDKGFKSNVFNLTCPIAACKQQAFATTKAFEKHMNREHSAELPFETDCCDARFKTKELRDRHAQVHAAYVEVKGEDTACCAICGTLDLWSLPKNTHIDCLQSHTIRHGLDLRTSCRFCLKQFASDIDYSQIIDHVIREHGVIDTATQFITCRICGRSGMDRDEFGRHSKMQHVFHILCKSQHSVRGELVVTTGEEYERYVGLLSGYKAPVSIPTAAAASSASSSSSAPSLAPSLAPAQLLYQRRPGPSTSTSSTFSAASGAPTPPSLPPQASRATPPVGSMGGNAALLTIAASIGDPVTQLD